jgi:hypothetical protein
MKRARAGAAFIVGFAGICAVAAMPGDIVPADGEVVTLPPFLVEHKSMAPSWRYAETPEFEILSDCDDAKTREIAERFHRLHQLFNFLAPVDLQAKSDVPKSLMLYDDEILKSTSQEVVALLKSPDAGGPAARIPHPARQDKTIQFDTPSLFDDEKVAVFISVPAELAAQASHPNHSSRFVPSSDPVFYSFPSSQASRPLGWTNLTPGYVGHFLAKRTPPLPDWFVVGFLSVYRQAVFRDDSIVLAPLTWTAGSATRAMRDGGDAPADLLPVAQLLAGQRPDQDIRAWMSSAELLVRWGLDEQNRDSFWKLVRRCSAEKATEPLLRDCVGGGYAQVDEWLRSYLSTAVKSPMTLSVPEVKELPRWRIRNATPGEIARIKGDWERLEANYVRAKYPELELHDRYFDAARRTLHKAYDRGERDPRLVAALGLCELDAGNPEAARPFLQAAAQQRVVRPRVYLELARLEFAERKTPPQKESESGPVSIATIMEHLAQARQQAPALPDIYQLAADVWLDSDEPMTAAEMALVEEGLVLFPRNSGLLLKSGHVFLHHGHSERALALAERGSSDLADDDTREGFRQLRIDAETAVAAQQGTAR